MPSGISEDDLVAGFLGKAVRKEPEPEPEPEPPKMLIGTCIVCESPFTFESKRGKNPQMCSDQCRAENKRQKKKPKEKIVREHKCKTCDRQIVQTGRGGKRLFCGVCREERRKEAYKKYRQKNRVPVERERATARCADVTLASRRAEAGCARCAPLATRSEGGSSRGTSRGRSTCLWSGSTSAPLARRSSSSTARVN